MQGPGQIVPISGPSAHNPDEAGRSPVNLDSDTVQVNFAAKSPLTSRVTQIQYENTRRGIRGEWKIKHKTPSQDPCMHCPNTQPRTRTEKSDHD